MKTLPTILLSFLLGSTICEGSASPSAFPPEIAALKNGEVKTYLVKVSDLPASVRQALTELMQTEKLEMADKGKAWNATDVRDRTLPFRRLIWAAEVKQHFIVHYEMGGIGHSFHFVVFSSESEAGHRTLEWAAASDDKVRNLAGFVRMVESGKTHSHPAMIH